MLSNMRPISWKEGMTTAIQTTRTIGYEDIGDKPSEDCPRQRGKPHGLKTIGQPTAAPRPHQKRPWGHSILGLNLWRFRSASREARKTDHDQDGHHTGS